MVSTLRSGRLATFAFFALNGFALGLWVVHIPAVEHRAGVGHAVLGRLLLLLGAGSFAGMQLAGPLTDRLGARTTLPAGAVLCSAALALPGLATGPWTLGAALLLLGVGNGCLDVAMNAHAVQVEHGYGRPVMSAFHAAFSIGGMVAALVGARTLDLGWSAATTLAAAGALGLAVTALAAPALLRPAPGGPVRSGSPRRGTRYRTPPHVWRLAGLALLLMLCEGVAADWSALHLRDSLGATPAVAALAYGAFSTAMTAGRLFGDRLAAALGPVALVRGGAALAAAGLALAAFAPSVPAALLGWTALGAGLAGCVPQVFSAAGRADGAAAGATVSRVAGLGYLGMLAGPAAIGALTRVVPLNLTLLLPLGCCAVAAGAAGILGRGAEAPGGTAADGAAAEPRRAAG